MRNCLGFVALCLCVLGCLGSDPYADYKTLRRPGNCHSHPDFPNTVQCAITRQCISFIQYKDGWYDCCGPRSATRDPSACPDRSDENRVMPPGNMPQCSAQADALSAAGHADEAQTLRQAISMGLTMQCAITGRCVSRLYGAGNGVCDCCGPDHDCSTCEDHSDEDPCLPDEMRTKGSCQGLCLQWSNFLDNVTHCSVDCVEPDVDTPRGRYNVHERCLAATAERQRQGMLNLCDKIYKKNTPHMNCTSDDRCALAAAVRNGARDCAGGEDEDARAHPDCDTVTKAAHCKTGTNACVMVAGGKFVDCRCSGINDESMSCNLEQRSKRKK